MAVTVQGNGGALVGLMPSTGDVLQLAGSIGQFLTQLNTANPNVLNADSVSVGAGPTTVTGPSNNPNKINFLDVEGSGGGQMTIPSGYQYALLNTTSPETVTASNAIVVANAAGDSFSVTGNSTVAITGGSASVAASDSLGQTFIISGATSGNDTITASGFGTIGTGSGNNLINASGNLFIQSTGHDVINVDAGNSTVLSTGDGTSFTDTSSVPGGSTISATFSGAAASVNAGVSDMTAQVSGSNALVWGGSGGMLNLTVSGSQATVFGSTIAGGQLNITDMTSAPANNGLIVSAGADVLNFVGGSSLATVFGGAGGTGTVSAGSGGLQLSGLGGDYTVGGSANGSATLWGSSGNTLTYEGNGSLLYSAQAGNESLFGGNSAATELLYGSTIKGTSDYIQGGSGTVTFVAGAGSDTFVSSGQHNAFDFQAVSTAGAADYVQNWSNTDSVNLYGYGTVAPTVSSAGANAVLTLSDKTTVTFLNASAADIQAHLYGG